MNLENAAYSDEYIKRREHEELKFKMFDYKEERSKSLNDKLTLRIKVFNDKNNFSYQYKENQIRNENDNTIYNYISNGETEICSVISHKDGNEYIIFNRDLYGYSVLNLSTMEDFYYYPRCSLNIDGKFEETFIWTDAHYNPLNNILAVDGCYWAAPSGVILLDFSQPMQQQLHQVNIQDKIDTDYIKYEDIIFDYWENTNLHLVCYDIQSNQNINIVLKADEYTKWIQGDI